METAHRQENPRPVLDFTRHVDEKKNNYIGRNGRDESKPFIPVAELEKYWKKRKIEAVCKAYKPHLPTTFDAIQTHSLRIWSILVYLGKVQYFHIFPSNNISDDQLPFGVIPPALSAPAYHELFQDIFEYQWLFCPLVLDYARLSDLKLEPRHILPFHGQEKVKVSDAAHIFKVRVHKECNKAIKVRP
jgi:hypothetical protein